MTFKNIKRGGVVASSPGQAKNNDAQPLLRLLHTKLLFASPVSLPSGKSS